MDESASERAKRLRRDQTHAERKLWSRLRSRQLNGAKFRRQHPIGPYIVDFCCLEKKLAVELDGGHHTERMLEDRLRSDYLMQHGYRVLRFWNHEILGNIESVLICITNILEDPRPSPLPERERKRLMERYGDEVRRKGVFRFHTFEEADEWMITWKIMQSEEKNKRRPTPSP